MENSLPQNQSLSNVLEMYAAGRITSRKACRSLGLRDGSELLLALAKAGLEQPLPPEHVLATQAEDFARLWTESGSETAEVTASSLPEGPKNS